MTKGDFNGTVLGSDVTVKSTTENFGIFQSTMSRKKKNIYIYIYKIHKNILILKKIAC